ncbi:hypothetical protein [Arcobacter aquimarinus]|uniref:hypothetical protein n=1 Tax=Arcobacter aquimarinus TaxID=1315211 RepID=UPI003BB0AC19
MYMIPKKKVLILESNLADIDSNYIQFVPNSSYALGVEVQYGEDIFRSLDGNNNSTPIPERTTIGWKYLKKANKWASFDPYNSTKTIHETEIMYIVESRYVDYIALLELRASKVKLELFKIEDDVSIADPIWKHEEKTYYRNCFNYSEYITKDGIFKRTFMEDVFPYYGTKLKITITGTNVEVGNIIYGKKIDLGMVLTNGLVEEFGNLIDIEIDRETGNIKQVPIMPRKDLTIPVYIETKNYERVKNILEDYLGIPCLFVALKGVKNRLPSVALYGFYKNIRTPIGAEYSEYELLIKGIV